MRGSSSKLRVQAHIQKERYFPVCLIPLGTVMFEKKQVLAVGEESYWVGTYISLYSNEMKRGKGNGQTNAFSFLRLISRKPISEASPCPLPVLCPTNTAVIQSVLRIISDRGIRSAVDVF